MRLADIRRCEEVWRCLAQGGQARAYGGVGASSVLTGPSRFTD